MKSREIYAKELGNEIPVEPIETNAVEAKEKDEALSVNALNNIAKALNDHAQMAIQELKAQDRVNISLDTFMRLQQELQAWQEEAKGLQEIIRSAGLLQLCEPGRKVVGCSTERDDKLKQDIYIVRTHKDHSPISPPSK